MAATGATPIILYHSTTGSQVPVNTNLSPGELALNIADMKLYCENSSGTVTLLASAAGASGDVVGPSSATDNAVARFDLTTGKIIQNSVVTIADTTGNIAGLGDITFGTQTNKATLTYATNTARTLTVPNVGGNRTLGFIDEAQTFTAAQTFRAANAIRSEAASTQDAIVIAGRAGGTNSRAVTIVPTTLGANRTLTLPDATTTVVGTDATQTLTNKTLGATTLSGTLSVADNLVDRPTLKDYAIEGQAVGNTGGTRTLDLNDANFFSATLDQACTFTFADPPASGDFGCFVLELTNGGAFAITWPAAVDWPGGAAPSLTASGKDQLVFTTRDAGTTWFGFVAGYDIK